MMGRQGLKYVLICFLALLFVGLVGFNYTLYTMMFRPMISGQHKEILIKVDKASSAFSFVHTLKSKNLIRSETFFLSLIRIQGSSNHLKAGIYRVEDGESATHFLSRVVSGDVLKLSFRVTEGTTQRQIATDLKQAPYLVYQDSDWSRVANGNPEGLILADTYQYNALSSGSDLLAHAHETMEKYLDAVWQQRAKDLPYKTPYDLLIVASILEKESAIPEERRLISGVVVNRLKKHMPLQMDPTVIYAKGDAYHGKLTHKDLQIDSPYNTYRYRGLPPTPIAMVGRDSIDAAAHPKQTNYLYFVARGDGTHCFSASYEAQRQAIAKYLRTKHE